MKNNEPSFLDLLLETHIDLERQGPGSPEVIEQALGFIGPLGKAAQMADLGCGTGGQTMLLAKHLQGNITGLDMFPAFIDRLNKNAKHNNLQSRVRGVVGKMEDLPFEKRTLDLIWSEGAIDNIGFKEGLTHWRHFLKTGGYVAVSCPSWITKERPADVEKFWSGAGSSLDTTEKNIEIMQNCGYGFVAAFTIPNYCWTDNYYAPREKAISALMKKYENSQTMKEYAQINRREVELFNQYNGHYGYVFYIGKAI